MNERLLHVHIQDSYKAALISYEQFLEEAVPEDACVDALVWVPYCEELSSISRIEPLQVLIVTDGEDEVGLHDNQHLDYPDSVQACILLCKVKYTILGPPLLRRFELQCRAFGISSIDSNRLSFLDIEAGDPDVIVDEGWINGSEVFDNLQRNKPGIH